MEAVGKDQRNQSYFLKFVDSESSLRCIKVNGHRQQLKPDDFDETIHPFSNN